MENGQQQKFYILEKDGVYRTVKRGFSWTAFFFASYVPLWRKDWISFIYIYVITRSIFFFNIFVYFIIKKNGLDGFYSLAYTMIYTIIYIILWVFLWAKKYNEYNVRNLLRQGWELKEEVSLDAVPHQRKRWVSVLLLLLFLIFNIYTSFKMNNFQKKYFDVEAEIHKAFFPEAVSKDKIKL